jgi:hypothetical protein
LAQSLFLVEQRRTTNGMTRTKADRAKYEPGAKGVKLTVIGRKSGRTFETHVRNLRPLYQGAMVDPRSRMALSYRKSSVVSGTKC